MNKNNALQTNQTTELSLETYNPLGPPKPIRSSPTLKTRLGAYVTILLGGLLGSVVGYGIADLLSQGQTWLVVGMFTGSIAGAIGVGTIVVLAIQAMIEWRATEHPEEQTNNKKHSSKC